MSEQINEKIFIKKKNILRTRLCVISCFSDGSHCQYCRLSRAWKICICLDRTDQKCPNSHTWGKGKKADPTESGGGTQGFCAKGKSTDRQRECRSQPTGLRTLA